MQLNSGTRLGAYEIVGPLGAGGMGEVYRARDRKLNRDVALKILPDAFTHDPDRLARFKREAQVLASLNHPNIAAIYGFEDSDGTQALVLELVEGPTLADLIDRGQPTPEAESLRSRPRDKDGSVTPRGAPRGLALDEALPIARQIAEALEAAHEQGIIHRDLKPANIKLRPDGTVKVLDFGLARALAPTASVAQGLTNSPTITSPLMTGVGVLLGTAAYMAPEQAKGRPVDARADIWAFGVVLFEMLSGRRPFDGEDATEVLGAVVRMEPDWKALPADVLPRIRQLIRACLQKQAKQRIAHMQDVRLALDGVFETSTSETLAVALPPIWQRPIPVLFTTAALCGLIGLGIVTRLRPDAVDRPIVRFSVRLPDNQTYTFGGRHVLAMSPDGASLVYSANRTLWLRRLDQEQATQLRGADDEARNPFFSPDGRWIGFFAGNQLRKVAVTGGAPVVICQAENPFGVSWGRDDDIVFGQPDGIWHVSATGGRAELLIKTEPGEQAHGPQRLPDGDWMLFTLRAAGSVAWDDAQIVVQSLSTGTREVVVEKGRDARYLGTGHLIFGLGGTLYAALFDLSSQRVVGGATPVIDGVQMTPDIGGFGNTAAVQFAVSDNGTLAYVPGNVDTAGRTLSWLGADGQQEPVPLPARSYTALSLSPDGARVALEIADGSTDVWVGDVKRGGLVRLTTARSVDGGPLWSERGDKVYFTSMRSGPPELYSRLADGTGVEERAATFDDAVIAAWARGWSPDGRVLMQVQDKTTGWDVALLSLDGSGKLEFLLKTDANESHPSISPDGHWLAYSSNETGVPELYVQRFPQLGDKHQLSVVGMGNNSPTWSRTGKALVYLSAQGGTAGPREIMRVPIQDVKADPFGPPVRVRDFSYFAQPSGTRFYDLSRQDDRLLLISGRPFTLQLSDGISVILNWAEQLKRQVPVN